jgi:hypothetical protein
MEFRAKIAMTAKTSFAVYLTSPLAIRRPGRTRIESIRMGPIDSLASKAGN